jgi:hypothetical protein
LNRPGLFPSEHLTKKASEVTFAARRKLFYVYGLMDDETRKKAVLKLAKHLQKRKQREAYQWLRELMTPEETGTELISELKTQYLYSNDIKKEDNS